MIQKYDYQSIDGYENKSLENIPDVPLSNPSAEYFIDGSRSWDKDQGRIVTGYAVVQNGEAMIQKPLPSTCMTQDMELKAITAACDLGKGNEVNIPMDSR